MTITTEQRAAVWASLLSMLQQAVAMCGALAATFTIGFWLIEPRLEDWVRSVAVDSQLRNEVVTNAQHIAEIRQGLAEAGRLLAEIRAGASGVDEAPLEFLERGNRISHAHVGAQVTFTWYFRKLHDCGAPKVDAFFRDADGVLHRFSNLSITDVTGEGVNIAADPERIQSITYSGFMPVGNHVAVGVAHGWVNLRYGLCPRAPEARSPEVRFQVLPTSDNVNN